MIIYDLLHKTIFFKKMNLTDYTQQVSLQKISRMIMTDSNNCLPR